MNKLRVGFVLISLVAAACSQVGAPQGVSPVGEENSGGLSSSYSGLYLVDDGNYFAPLVIFDREHVLLAAEEGGFLTYSWINEDSINVKYSGSYSEAWKLTKSQGSQLVISGRAAEDLTYSRILQDTGTGALQKDIVGTWYATSRQYDDQYFLLRPLFFGPLSSHPDAGRARDSFREGEVFVLEFDQNGSFWRIENGERSEANTYELHGNNVRMEGVDFVAYSIGDLIYLRYEVSSNEVYELILVRADD